jgi:hypothetical protein
MKTSRRTFLIAGAGLASSVALGGRALAAPAKVEESDPVAIGLSYKHDAALIDKAAQPKYTPGEHCGNCQLFQGQASDAWAPCAIFAGKLVAGPGWCSAYSKKA